MRPPAATGNRPVALLGEWTGRFVALEFSGDIGAALFDPRCPHCARFWNRQGFTGWANEIRGMVRTRGATCSLCGEVQPIFLGFY